MFRRAVAFAHYVLNVRPAALEPRGSNAYRKANEHRARDLRERATALLRRLNLPGNRETTGAGDIDYLILYEYVRQRRPATVVEFGTGTTTMIMAHAMQEVGFGRIVTIDHIAKFSDETREAMPADLRPRVEFVLTWVEAEMAEGVTTLRYHDAPNVAPDMVFVDGPPTLFGKQHFPSSDALHLVKTATVPADIIIDRRLATARYLSEHLGRRAVFDPLSGFVAIAGNSTPPSRFEIGDVMDALSLT